MPRIPEAEIARLKRETDLAALVRSRGITLKRHGSKDLIGHCPFHDDKTPSFAVTPSKNLYHCLGCGAAGSVIDFLMSHEGLSFRHAVELLREGKAHVPTSNGKPVKRASTARLDSPLDPQADDTELMGQALAYYRERLQQTPSALEYLQKRGIGSDEVLNTFGLGFADRTLGLRLPDKNRHEGQELRQRLLKLGLYRESGHEHFNGCVVVPIGNGVEIYGRRVAKQKSGIYHLYLPGPHAGIFNANCLQQPEIILCESVFDALTFWAAGQRNVTCIYGTEGFTDELLEAFRSHQTQRIYLAYDRDEAGERAVKRDAEKLRAFGVECFRVNFPFGMDANEYARKVTPATKSLEVLVQSAEWLGKGKAPSPLAAPEAAKEEKPATKPAEMECTVDGTTLTYTLGERSYRVRGWESNQSLEVLKVNLRLRCADRFHLDTLDLCQARQRQAFIQSAAEETRMEPDLIKRDLGKLLLQLEQRQEEHLNQTLEPAEPVIEMSEADRKEALALLRAPDLLERILADFHACGVVGEDGNKLTGYLAAVSRLLERPLGVIVQSTSAAGKTTLMEAVLAFMPEEQRSQYSAMTGQSLYYLGQSDLRHKILAIVEEEGAEKASYALKLLQSEGRLTIASTGKDPGTGRLRTEEYEVEGPVMIFLTTTAADIDEELLNRCLVLSVDEGREQTEAIHRLQREQETLAGLQRKLERDRLLNLHRNAQRLLKPLHVVNPFAPQLTFLSERTRTRRDHTKYLALIRTIALLHQHQREAKPLPGKPDASFIEVTKDDIAAANRLAHEVLGRSLDELPPQTRELLRRLDAMVRNRCEAEKIERSHCRFTRRQAREHTGWSNTQLKLHLDRLEDFEYLLSHRGRRGQSFEYELMFDGDPESATPQLTGLLDPDRLSFNYDAKFTGSETKFTGPDRPQNAPVSGGVRKANNGVRANGHRTKRTSPPAKAKTTVPGRQVAGVVS